MQQDAGRPEGHVSDILTDYRQQLESIRNELAAVPARRLRAWIATIVFGFMSVCALGLFASGLPHGSLLCETGGAGFVFCLQMYRKEGRSWRTLQLREESVESGVARLTHTWQRDSAGGMEFARPGHPYQAGLQVLGDGSLFALLNTTRTKLGAARLAAFLLDPATFAERQRRQESVQELQDRPELFPKRNLLRGFESQDCSAEELAAWLQEPMLPESRAAAMGLLALSGTSLLLGLGMFVQAVPLHWWPVLVSLVLAELAIASALRRRIAVHLQAAERVAGAFVTLQDGIALLEKLQFKSPHLRQLTEGLRTDYATRSVGKLNRLLHAITQREKPEFFLVSRALAVGTQLVFAIDRWRACHGADLQRWLDCWANFDALLALSLYAFEHPDYIFPELVEEPGQFRAQALGHPLLPACGCVANDVNLDPDTRFYLITGSNMAGKSTLLRAIGLNAILAQAGAPVRARTAALSSLEICAAFPPPDSLRDGRSRFLAEVEQLSSAVTRVRAGASVLFLVDELLSGTNAQDRRAAARGILRALLARDGIGAIATHDVELKSLVEELPGGVLMHMESNNPADPLDFDYRLRPGLSTLSSAPAILRLIGVMEQVS